MSGKRFVVYGNNTTKRVISDPIRMQVAMLKTRETKCLAAIIYLVVTVKEGEEGGNRKEAACPHWSRNFRLFVLR